MAINKLAVTKFLNRELNDHNWIKKESAANLDAALDDLDMGWHTKPWTHQKACLLIAAAAPKFLFLLDMGTGKTKIILDAVRYWRREGTLKSALVVVPNVTNIDNWEEQWQIHAPDLDLVPMYGSTKERWALFGSTDADVYVINYAGLLHMLCDGGIGKKGKMTPSKKLRKRLLTKINGLILDESQALKSKRSLTFRICNPLAKACDIAYCLTGTPMGRDPTDLWTQFYVVDNGDTLGPTLGLFREAYFTKSQNYWSGGWDYKFDPKMEKKLHRALRNISIVYDEDECNDVPPKVPVVRHVKLPKEAEAYYADVVREVQSAKGKYKVMQNVFTRMRQLTSGYLNFRDENDEVVSVEFARNPKLEQLEDLVLSKPRRAKMVIFYEFTKSGDFICDLLDAHGIQYGRLWSGTKDHRKTIRRFKNDKGCEILVANWRSGSSGLNLQVANWVVFYESPVSPIDRAQAEKRCLRSGQKANRVFICDLVVRNSVDQRILDCIEEGVDLFDALVRGKEKVDKWDLPLAA